MAQQPTAQPSRADLSCYMPYSSSTTEEPRNINGSPSGQYPQHSQAAPRSMPAASANHFTVTPASPYPSALTRSAMEPLKAVSHDSEFITPPPPPPSLPATLRPPTLQTYTIFLFTAALKWDRLQDSPVTVKFSEVFLHINCYNHFFHPLNFCLF